MKRGRAESLSHPPTSAELPLGCCVQAPLVGRSVGLPQFGRFGKIPQ